MFGRGTAYFCLRAVSETTMKKEFWRKAPQCSKCVYYSPEGTRPDPIDPTTEWKEACLCSGYFFWPEMEDAEICFDFRTKGRHPSKDKDENDQWAMVQACPPCSEEKSRMWKEFIALNISGESAE